MVMSENIKERYGPYPKKKEKRRVRSKEDPFLKRTDEWLKWKIENIGNFPFHHPCLEP
jgi:hypothetical protein